jgi:hypothetical protein
MGARICPADDRRREAAGQHRRSRSSRASAPSLIVPKHHPAGGSGTRIRWIVFWHGDTIHGGRPRWFPSHPIHPHASPDSAHSNPLDLPGYPPSHRRISCGASSYLRKVGTMLSDDSSVTPSGETAIGVGGQSQSTKRENKTCDNCRKRKVSWWGFFFFFFFPFFRFTDLGGGATCHSLPPLVEV